MIINILEWVLILGAGFVGIIVICLAVLGLIFLWNFRNFKPPSW